jgi:transglutaminase-like putative cysteine protease
MQMQGLRIPHSLSLDIPEGAEGTRETLKQMRRLVRDGKTNLALRDLAQQIISCVPGKDWCGELAALLNWTRRAITYRLDTNDIEVIQGPATTLCLGYGDCDDLSILLATLCECAGHPCSFIAVGFDDPGEYSHVFILASGAGETEWIPLDASEANPPGWFPPGVTCAMYCPITTVAQRRLEGIP